MAKPEKLTTADVEAACRALVTDSITYTDAQLSPDRAKATEYYLGQPFGDEEKGHPQTVLTDVRDVTLAMLPSFVRIFFPTSGHVVEYQPRPKSEAEIPRAVALAEQATEFINEVVLDQDNNGFIECHSAFKDALVRKIGTIKYWWEDNSSYQTQPASQQYVNQEESFVADPDVEVTKKDETVENGLVFYDLTYNQWRREGIAKLVCTPPEELLVSRDARSREDASLIAHRTEKTRGELIGMGVDPKEIDEFGGPATELQHNIEEIARRGIVATMMPTDRASDKNLWIEAYPYLDVDGDGTAELVRCRLLGPGYHLVGDPEPVDERPFAIFCPDPEPHVLIGQSIADRTMDAQKSKSNIMRAMLESLAKSIHPDEAYQTGMVSRRSLESTTTPRTLECEGPPAQVYQEFSHEFAGEKALAVLNYWDQVVQRRVGPLPATLDPDALQSTPEVGVKATVQAASEQLELIARIFAGTGFKQLFKGLLKLLVEHQPRARIVRLRNQFVAVDPKAWDAEMDVSVNVALGTQEKLGVLVATAAKQEQILQLLGPTNPLCGLGQLRHTYGTLLELQGFKDTTKFFNPLPSNWQPPAQPPQPDPNMVLAQAEMQKAQAALAKQQADFQIAQVKAAQEMADLKAQLISKEAELQLEREGMHLTDDRERDKAEADIALRAAELNAKYPTDRAIAELEAQLRREEMATKVHIASLKPAPSNGGNGGEHPKPPTVPIRRKGAKVTKVSRDAQGQITELRTQEPD